MKEDTIFIFSLQYYPRMAVPSFDAVYFVPIGWRIIRIGIICVIDDPIIRIDAWKYNGEQVVFPGRPEK